MGLFSEHARIIRQTVLCLFGMVVLLPWLPSALYARPLSQEAFVALLEKNHPVFEKERLSRPIEQAQRESARGSVDWNLSSSLSWSRQEETITLFNPDVTKVLSFQTGLSRQFWETGGTISTIYTFGRTSSTFQSASLFDYPDRFYENSLEFQYSQPLLKNRGGRLSRLQYDLKAFDVDVADIQARENIEEFLADALTKYLDWVWLEEQKAIMTRRLDLSRKELHRAQRKFKAYLVDSVDVVRAKDAVNIWMQNLGLVESRLLALRSELSVLAGDPVLLTGSPEFDLYALPHPAPLASAQEQLDRSRLLKILALRKQQLEVSARGAKETGKPDLALIAAVTAKSAAERNGDSFTFDKKDAALGLQLSVPIGNTTAKADLRRRRLQTLQLEKEQEEAALTLDASLSSLHRQLTQLRKVIELNRMQIETAQSRTSGETKLYEQGRGDLTFVIMARDNEESARLAYAENALNYQKLWLRYQALLDELYE